MIQTQQHTVTVSDFARISGRSHAMEAMSEAVLTRLSSLSQLKRWILFTANCPRPDLAELSAFDVNCNSVIQMKASLQLTEEEIVIKAIQAGTASAIVASSAISPAARARIMTLAAQHTCSVFFIGQQQGQWGMEYTHH